jgi:hypothetical protein
MFDVLKFYNFPQQIFSFIFIIIIIIINVIVEKC